MDNRGIEPVRSGTKKGRTNPGLAGVEKITSIWESTGWRITVERSRLMTITRHAAALLLYKVSCRFSGAGFQPENDSSRSSRMFVLELAHRRFPDHRRPPPPPPSSRHLDSSPRQPAISRATQPTRPPGRWWPGERAPFWGLWCVQMAVHREITRGCAQLHGCTEYMPDHRPNVRPTNTN